MVTTHLFKIQFPNQKFKIYIPTIKFLAKFFIKSYRLRFIHQKLNSKGCGGDYTFVQNSISYKKLLSKISYKNASISTYSPKTEFERFFLTPGGDMFVSYKNALVSTYSPETEFEKFFPSPGDYTFVQN